MFNLNEFIMKTLKGMVGHYPDFQVREYAANWYAKGTLTMADVEEIDMILEAQYIVPEVPEVVEPEMPEEVLDEHEPMVIPEIVEDEVPVEEPVVEETTEGEAVEETPAEEPEAPVETTEE